MKRFARLRAAYDVLRGRAGAVLPYEEFDLVTEQPFRVSITKRYTRIAVGPRTYYFNTDGTFDGTSYSFCEGVPVDDQRVEKVLKYL
ncbi:hypothetical protein [Alicyclobacillus sendaiensis]|uniref:hypothetical protein n=1 Tax=Alicyclobacillus sendaiensis TaxID=192387 RepID=UPI0026F476B6|nr:hypothetical protein [Alicyclobacillus sendaiensis]